MSAGLLLYDLLVDAAVAFVLAPREIARRLAGRAESDELRQRLGRITPSAGAGTRILIHAVSVGEMTAAGPLLPELERRIPDLSILLTAGNCDGLAAAARLRERRPAIGFISLLPWDRGHAMRSWLRRLRPDFVIVVETEIWPNLFRACADLAIPLAVVNGRISPRDASRYRLARPFFRRVLGAAIWIEAQTGADRQRFIEIGAAPERVQVTGNLKFDSVAPEREARPGEGVVDRLVVAGSTHAPEERVLLDCLQSLRSRHPTCRLTLAPRNISRAHSIARLARRKGFRVALDSDGTDHWDVLVIDQIGGLAPLYRRAEIAVIGGTFGNRGGHNPIEAAACARPIIAGPSRDNFAEIFGGLEAARALESIDATAELTGAIDRLLADPERRRGLGARAREFARRGRGAAAICAERIAAVLERSPDRD